MKDFSKNVDDNFRAALNNSDIVSIMSSDPKKRVSTGIQKPDNLRAILNGSKVFRNRT